MELQEGQPVEVADNGTEVIQPEHSYSWQASEFIFHQKTNSWYVTLWLVTAAICLVLGLLAQWLAVAMVVVMALAVVVYSRKEPRTLGYAVDDHGVSVEGKVTAYKLFRSYSIHQDLSWQTIDLEPTQRFVPRLTLLCENENIEQIASILAQHLPRVQRSPDLVERLTRYLKF
ncbi:MAG TPA: hypothetical protein VLF21_00395 [Candidatus Saccharimonadales bacterium]|nr:hypothetical protein [Candidatus Saccharimonadales bacterium]